MPPSGGRIGGARPPTDRQTDVLLHRTDRCFRYGEWRTAVWDLTARILDVVASGLQVEGGGAHFREGGLAQICAHHPIVPQRTHTRTRADALSVLQKDPPAYHPHTRASTQIRFPHTLTPTNVALVGQAPWICSPAASST